MSRTVTTVSIINNVTSVPPLSLNLILGGDIHRGVPVSGLKLVATGGVAPYTYATTGAPAGLSFDPASGIGSGSATTIGHVVFTATVTDHIGTPFSIKFTIDVKSRLIFAGGSYGGMSFPGNFVNGPFSVPLSGALPNAVALALYPFNAQPAFEPWQILVTGNTGAVSYAVVSGALPAGIACSSIGAVQDTGSGVTAAASTTPYTGVIRATDATTLDTLDIPFAITVYPSFINVTMVDPIGPYDTFPVGPTVSAAYVVVEGSQCKFLLSADRGAGYSTEGLYTSFPLISGTKPSWMDVANTSPTTATLALAPPVGWSAANPGYLISCGPGASSIYGGVGNPLIATLRLEEIDFSFAPPQNALQTQVGGVNVASGFRNNNLNIQGGGVSATSDGTTTTYTLPTVIVGSVVTVTANSALAGSGASNRVIVNAAATTQTLPAAPSAGDEFIFVPTALCTSLTINPNGQRIETTIGSMTCDLTKPNGSVVDFSLTYVNATEGWSVA